MNKPCPFCTFVLADTPDRPIYAATERVVAFPDAFASAPGHTLIIPRRHVGRLDQLDEAEYAELFAMARDIMRRHANASNPDAFTLGVNDGPAAGQSVPHVHLHVIPRVLGDTAVAAMGIRRAIPETADYRGKDPVLRELPPLP